MNKVTITITGSGATFGSITKGLELLFKELGANVEVKLDHETATMDENLVEKNIGQIEGREIIIETKSSPWGG